ncbi:class I SAM-dependent methyltransferase [Azospira restricta]|uniref:Class I SAM-dependent methyltransferase n=1 Tax=Azospira restricta TaxID=404405 RepID=A0A974Y506_9RHOO|nr:class I SAM-dependent methyltransferase [Azospira restricta]QRJ64881.1 class I SAM-dependent methyltransferase [Azospira restricta]
MSPPLRQLALQFAAVVAVLSLAWPYYGIRGEALPWAGVVLAIGAAAFLLAALTRQPWWWQTMHALFAPLAWAVAQLQIDPGWFLAAAILLLLVYRGALSGQVPLYLSNRETADALAELLPAHPGLRVVDLGAGLGSVLRPLAAARPDAHFVGVENAPLTWLAGRLLCLGRRNCELRWGSLWQTPLADCDVVYAFLSPVPMAALWEKAKAEMKPGSLFISNSFPVPTVEPNAIVEVGDGRATRLYCYRR